MGYVIGKTRKELREKKNLRRRSMSGLWKYYCIRRIRVIHLLWNRAT